MTKYILGINAIYHEPSACLIKDGKLITAVEEERFNRVKHSKFKDVLQRLPIESINFCLDEGDIKIKDINSVGFSYNPFVRCKFVANNFINTTLFGYQPRKKILKVPKQLSELYKCDLTKKFHWVDHHLGHASSAFFVSPFKESAILSIDGIGEYCSTWLGYGENNQIKKVKVIDYPHSVGFLWEVMSEFLGYSKYDAAKIMGLTSFGNPDKYQEHFEKIVKLQKDGFIVDKGIIKGYALPNKPLFSFFKYSNLQKIFGKRRKNTEDLLEKHYDLAAALQKITEDIILNLCKYLKETTGSDNLTMAGGVALNCVTNGLIAEKVGFKDIYIQPGAHDAGTAIGAAYYIWNQLEKNEKNYILYHPFLGPKFSNDEIKQVLEKTNLIFSFKENIENITAKLLSEKKLIGWFQGRMEFGPRALGHRSILADPRDGKIVAKLNTLVKKREWFRPYCPAVLSDRYSDLFEINKPMLTHQFMLFAVKAKNKTKAPAIVHVDDTSRVQLVDRNINPKFYKLLSEFEKITDVPVILNTSFNRRGEPIVCTPENAIDMFVNTGLDYLVLNDYLVEKRLEK